MRAGPGTLSPPGRAARAQAVEVPRVEVSAPPGGGRRRRPGQCPSAARRPYVRARLARKRYARGSGEKTNKPQVPYRPSSAERGQPLTLQSPVSARSTGSPASSRRRWSHIPRSGSREWPGRTCLRGSPYRLFLLIIVLYVENEVQTSRPVHPEANVASEKQPVYLGVRPHGLAYASWHSVAGLIREWPSCLLEFLVSRGR